MSRPSSTIYKWLILAAVVLSPALLQVYSYLWSETLFILEVLLFVPAYYHYLKSHHLKNLVWVSLLVAVSCITRYAGVTLILTGALLLLLDNRLPTRKKISHLLTFGMLSFSLLAGNLLLNLLSSGLSTGTREPSLTPLSKNLYYTGTAFTSWLGLPPEANSYAMLVCILLLLFLLVLLTAMMFKKTLHTAGGVVILFAIVYGLFIPVLASFSRFETLNSRLLSPMYIGLLIGCTGWAPVILKGLRMQSRLLVAAPLIMMMLLFEYAIFKADKQRYDDQGEYGVPGYTDDDWNKSQFISFLKTHRDIYQPGVPRYTDADEAVYFFTKGNAAILPHRYFKNDVDKFYGVKHYYLIWFNKLNNPELIGLQDILKREKLTLLYQLPEGAVYEYNAVPNPGNIEFKRRSSRDNNKH